MENKNQKSKIPPIRWVGKNQKLNKVLEEIVEKKKQDLIQQKKEIPLSKLKDFVSNLDSENKSFKKSIIKLNSENISLIAELKLASPASPTFNPDVNIIDRAKEYKKAGVDAISYISEKYFFKGNVSKIPILKAAVDIPILQKDFVIDEYQIYEAKIVGSDALLLIARLVDQKKLKKYVNLCLQIGIEPVVEINDEEDLNKAKDLGVSIIAVNSRDLRTFKVQVNKACKLLKNVPDRFIKLAFSGIESNVEIKKYKDAGANGVLVGTSIMKTKNLDNFVKGLINI